jgi:hypothetical protein
MKYDTDDAMNASILKNISWRMNNDEMPQRYHDDGNEDLVDLTEAEWNTVMHPSGPWCLHMEFDERALSSDEDYNWVTKKHVIERANSRVINQFMTVSIKRYEEFEAHATFRDVVMRIEDGYCYGFLEDIERVPLDRRYDFGDKKYMHSSFRVCYGT